MTKVNWRRATYDVDSDETRERIFGNNIYRSFGFYRTKNTAEKERYEQGDGNMLTRITKVKNGYVLWLATD